MDSRDFSSIIHSPSFTFLVGPRHTKLTIQSGLAQHVSKPLHNLMNNGHTRESKHRIAILEEEDAETFVAFCEYAYTGDYKVPQQVIPVPQEHRVSVAESVHSHANSWRGTYRSSSMSSAVPPPAPSPPPEFVDNGPKPELEGQPQIEPEPTVVEEPVAEAAAEVAAETPVEATADITPEATMEAAPETEAEAATEESGTAGDKTPLEFEALDQAPDAGLSPLPEADEQAGAEPVNETDDWSSWSAVDKPAETTEPEPKGKKGKKKDKKKKKNQPALEEDVTALTPPTTPPTNPVDIHELAPENATEEAADPAETEPVSEQAAEITSTESPAAGPTSQEPEQTEPEAEQAPLEPSDPEPAPESTTPPPEEQLTPNNDLQRDNEVWAEEDQPAADEPIDPPKPVIDMSFAKQPDTSPRTPGMSLWDEFANLRYTDERSIQTSVMNTTTDLPYLTFHAKVYVFATRYLIPALAQLCLRKLHCDLVQLSFAENASPSSNPILYLGRDSGKEGQTLSGLAALQAPRILDLIRYAYTKTTRLEPISPTSATQLRENELRRLVVHYAACKVKELARYRGDDGGIATPMRSDGREEVRSLRALLDVTPELASDLVYRMM